MTVLHMTTNRNPYPVVVLSGRKAAGKDTLAFPIAEALGLHAPAHLLFADPVKNDVDLFISACRGCSSVEESTCKIGEVAGVDPMTSAETSSLARILHDAAQSPAEHARSHSDAVVRALQFYGTEVRRSSDPDYWVRKACEAARRVVDAGGSAVFTDARFPNEIDGLKAAGAVTVRLEVSEDVQRQRLIGRDGYAPSVEMLSHSSETALDNYDGFDVVVDTSDSDTARIVAEVVRVCAAA